MAAIARMIEDRRGGKSYEKFAREIGQDFVSSTLFRIVNSTEKKAMNLDTVQKLFGYAIRTGDQEFANAIASYALGASLAVTPVEESPSP